MKLCIIAAVSRNGVIGRGNSLPWRLPADLKHFKTVTMGKPVIMGRKTYESIGRPLPGRLNIVVSRSAEFRAAGCIVVQTLADAIRSATREVTHDEVFVIGGSQLYAAALPRADRLYLTHIEADVEGDIHFPAFSASEWRILSSETRPADESNPFACRFETLERI